MNRTRLLGLLLIMLYTGLGWTAGLQAQEQCGAATSISYPIDRRQFRLVQDYGVASPRHQGRFHTGEDWFIGPRATLGQPVAAAARGRVTYSAPTGWGRDGGVVIIEHRLQDGTIFYTQYGHMMETPTITFPERLSCVEPGQIIGAVGDIRPAPHLHFEVRINQPDIPGPGYTRENPDESGWRRPEEVITNLQARLNRGFLWSASTGIEIAPYLLSDNSLLVADSGTLRRITADGRILWRVFTEQPIVNISGFQANPLLIYADGSVSRIDFDGNSTERWRLEFNPESPALAQGEKLIFHTSDDALVAISPDRRSILWRLDDIPRFEHGLATESLIGLVYEDQLRIISGEGQLLDSAEIEAGAALAALPDGRLLAYTQGGLWAIDRGGNWSEYLDDAVLPGTTSAAVTLSSDGSLYLTDGRNLVAYSRTGSLIWQAALPEALTGQSTLSVYDDLILLTNSDGHILAARQAGGFCGTTRIYGQPEFAQWHQLGGDGVLRFRVNQQVIGLDWEEFNRGC